MEQLVTAVRQRCYCYLFLGDAITEQHPSSQVRTPPLSRQAPALAAFREKVE